MKALFLTNEYPPNIYGGAGVHVDYLTRELAKLVNIEVRCFGDQKSESESLKVTGHGIDNLMFKDTDSQLKSPLQSLNRCVGFNASSVDADLVHCHTWYTHFGGILAKQTYGIPLVVTTHSLEPLRPWKREQLGRGYDLSCWVEKTAMEMADCVIAVSQGMKEDVLRLFDVDPDKIKVIYNGIDTDEYQPTTSRESLSRYGIDPDVPYVLFVGRITRQKGIIHLVNAISYLDPNIQVVLCAGAPDTEEIAQEMRDGVASVQEKRKHVVWIDEMVPKKTAIELYANAAVFCCPSIYEPFGIINLEAMACATPVVASAVGGIKEVVIHEETGFLVHLDQYQESPFEARNPDEFARGLADPINQLMRNEDLRRRIGEAGRKRATEVFSWRTIAREVRDLYQALVEPWEHEKENP
uniref:Glycogen synthase (ADP-glucose) n=1 Tax=Candidatus Kentrum sp. TUN TaxID=2126343 RepID=A0A450ZW29_9GAMM|nr:MAG: glycogen synthase (ADP-glucose) [Candidatus Kentron sp. TUN]VFK51420.1 MAG: glycogen synthase (ADP-glucose) [Candidatus Kentron sp. TUN]VFK58009.1 MAG: glycogen synthase (ADP-glucose) [Candidatus Kentron sp. TUN]